MTSEHKITDHSEAKSESEVRLSLPWVLPWRFMLAALLVISYYEFFPNLGDELLPEVEQRLFDAYRGAVVGVLLLVALLFDCLALVRYRREIKRQFNDLQHQLAFAWKSKKQLQQRSHIYYDHADKLKRFISDKLVEQIEYDEKFLHFKNIAAEIRHNGVISYDIVRNALETIVRQEPTSQESISLADTHRFGLPNNPNSRGQQALDAMKYLWDLLDLSSTDNIALHIGNYLIECEEFYFQNELKPTGEAGSVPVFSPGNVVLKALAPMLSTLEMDGLIAKVSTIATSETILLDQLFCLAIAPTEHLLGNQNHYLLLVENLIKNAQYFSGKVQFKQKSDRVFILLRQEGSHVSLSVYNRGPHIDEDEQEKLFRLGYSTRRTQEHHGRGLGLFFVNEIVRGYQGQIRVENIYNQTDTYSVRLRLHNGAVQTTILQSLFDGARPKVCDMAIQQYDNHCAWQVDGQLHAIEVTSSRAGVTQNFDLDGPAAKPRLVDTHSEYGPNWMIKLNQQGSKTNVQFQVLDISGACFHVLLPSAESSLRGDAEPQSSEAVD